MDVREFETSKGVANQLFCIRFCCVALLKTCGCSMWLLLVDVVVAVGIAMLVTGVAVIVLVTVTCCRLSLSLMLVMSCSWLASLLLLVLFNAFGWCSLSPLCWLLVVSYSCLVLPCDACCCCLYLVAVVRLTLALLLDASAVVVCCIAVPRTFN